MDCRRMKQAVKIRNASGKLCLLEASGGINLKTVVDIAKTGVDRISIGALTHSPGTIDFTMEFI